MRYLYFFAVLFGVLGTVIFIMTYTFFKIYKSRLLLFSIPILGCFPIIGMVLGRLYKIKSIEVFIGHFLFYYNYILLVALALILTFIVGKIFGKDFFLFLNMYKSKFSICLLLFIASLAFIGRSNFKNIKERNYKVSLYKEDTNLNLKIGFISDLHLNDIFDGSSFDFALKEMEAKNVDIVLIGGDLLDNDSSRITDNIKKIVSKYNFPQGIHTILGNHEYYGHLENNITFIERTGINLLIDDVLNIKGLKIIGRDDSTNFKRKKLNQLMTKSEESPTIILDHNPKSILESKENNANLQLSGHTHNGQLFPFNYLVQYLNLNGYGYKKIGNTHTIVSSGLGTWMIPYRIGSQSEYVIIQVD